MAFAGITIGQPSQLAVGQMTTRSLPVGTIVTPRGGQLGEAITSSLHGRYYETNYRGNVFHVASQAVATTTVGLATTYTGLVLSNPVNSTVNLSILQATIMQSVIQATQIEAFALAYGYNSSTNVTHTTPATTQSSFIGSTATSQGKADTSATLPTAPLYGDFITNTPSATTNSVGVQYDISGGVILPPGGYALFVTPAQASVAGMWFGFRWEEVPL